MKILIIEDEESLAKLLKMGLKKEGYAADYVLDGELGQKRIELYHRDYDAVILDLMLPKKSGLEVLKNIRQLNVSIPVLILTAKDSLDDKVTLLDAGADDYLIKPFHFNEVLARLRALTRRPEKVLPAELRIADLVLVPETKIVSRNGKEIKLTLKEFRLLEYLMRRPNQAVEREDLVDNIWDFQFDSLSNIVDVYINRLREKIDKDSGKKLIETIHGVGYKIKT
ncbi:MAG: response regulator transcription factor [Candidatus Pacebacteria bacterium]|nr:response regulator transcription factor [Candidatus Paceibacterota bacterium]